MDLEYLKENYLIKTNVELSKELNVSLSTVKRSLSKLGLKRPSSNKTSEIFKGKLPNERFKRLSKHKDFVISNFARIINLKTKVVLKQFTNFEGYKTITIQGKTYRVHILVAKAFIENPENKPQVNHLYGKDQNTEFDLEWSTSSENIKHAYDNNLMTQVGIDNGNVRHEEKVIHEICKLLQAKNPIKDISNQLNVNESLIKNIKYNGNWSHVSSQYNIRIG